ncbi:MAG: hypothetical protein IKS10_10920 [Lachnospiraceae bacterium]|nr:hypothetical protein [Lachnospiraceae bacterium]
MSTIIRMSRRAISDIEDIAEKIFYSEDLLETRVVCSDVIMGESSALMAPEAQTVMICFERVSLFRNADETSGYLTVLITQEGEYQKVRIFGVTNLARRARRVFELLEFEEYTDDEEYEDSEE